MGACLAFVALPFKTGAASQETSAATLASVYTSARRHADLEALAEHRPGYSFWEHVFTIPDGSIAYGSARDGRLLAVFPTKGNWARDGRWSDPALSSVLNGVKLPSRLSDRRDIVAARLEAVVGPIVHNPTRGLFVQPNARRYGDFLEEWSAIYERFGVPADLGLAQAMIESGFNPTRRSRAGAVGFCQWLAVNWRRLDTLAPNVIESQNQTTQAAYCAAYLSILATKYRSFVPALSEHHSGGTNVGRTLINGGRLDGDDVRERYFLGSAFARDVRQISLYGYRDLYRTYGPRSYAYTEMVFGNMPRVGAMRAASKQTQIFAMRTTRAVPLAEITRRARLSADDVRRFNPALIKQVPAGATIYLPVYISDFGADVSFWHRPAGTAYADVFDEFVRLDEDEEKWDDPEFAPVLRGFERRFRDTRTEEGAVMATVLAYVIDEAATSGRREILAEFRESEKVRRLFERAAAEREKAQR